MKKPLLMVLGLSLSLSALASDFEETKKLAESGTIEAQLVLAQDFYDKQDYVNAFKWYQTSANHGNAEANYKLAWMYLSGEGVTKNTNRFIEFLTKSANQGYALAQFHLALNYENGNYINGKIINQDYTNAKVWYEKASKQNYSEATFGLARLYFNGWGVPKDIKKALYYAQKSAEQGDTVAQLALAKAYENGTNLPQDYQKAFYWYQKATDTGFPPAQYHLAKMYQEGKGISMNLSLAKIWYTKACEQNEADSCNKSQALQQKGY